MGRFSPGELLVLALIFLLLFGGVGRLGNIGKGLADGIRNFKRGLKDEDDDDKGDPKQLDEGKRQAKNDQPDRREVKRSADAGA